jgi:hypothetical protein
MFAVTNMHASLLLLRCCVLQLPCGFHAAAHLAYSCCPYPLLTFQLLAPSAAAAAAAAAARAAVCYVLAAEQQH